jgi:hypothetical protein
VWPAGIEPAAPRVSGGRSTWLSYGHKDGRGWTRTSCLRAGDPPRTPSLWARLDLNQLPLVCETSALPLELLARELRDKESNLDLHVQSVVSYRLDDPGPISPLRPPSNGRSPQRRDPRVPALARSSEAERCFPSHSPALRPWIAGHRVRVRRPPSCVEELWSPILELGPANSHAKAHAPLPVPFLAPSAEGLSLSDGASIHLDPVQAEHHLWSNID